jgi:Ser/Thr protein kinase RdoA (MazF antagonist)
VKRVLEKQQGIDKYIFKERGLPMEHAQFETTDQLIKHFNYISERAKLLYPDHENLTVELLDYSENATYLVKNSRTYEKSILRVCRPNYHTKKQIEVEIEWILDIAKNSKVEVALPIAGSNGEYVQTVTNDVVHREYHCTMYTFLEGEAPKPSDENLLISDFKTLGEVTALLHKHAKSWERVPNLDRESWNY